MVQRGLLAPCCRNQVSCSPEKVPGDDDEDDPLEQHAIRWPLRSLKGRWSGDGSGLQQRRARRGGVEVGGPRVAQAGNLSDQFVQIIRMFHEVDIRGIDNQQRTLVVMEEVVVVGLIQAVDVFTVHVLFIVPTTLSNIRHETIGGRLQIDNQVRDRRSWLHDSEHGFIQAQFVAFEVDTSKDPVLVERVVGHNKIVEEVPSAQTLLLPETTGQETELCLEGPTRPVLVKALQEGVFFELFEDESGFCLLGQHLGQCGLARSDYALDNHILQVFRPHDGFTVAFLPGGLSG